MARDWRSGELSGLALVAAGFGLVAMSLAGYLIGHLIDRRFGTAPWGAIIGLLLGTAIGFYDIFRIASRVMNASPAPPPLPEEPDEKKSSDLEGDGDAYRENNHESGD